MPVFATKVIFGVFAVSVFSSICHWNLPAGQFGPNRGPIIFKNPLHNHEV